MKAKGSIGIKVAGEEEEENEVGEREEEEELEDDDVVDGENSRFGVSQRVCEVMHNPLKG